MKKSKIHQPGEAAPYADAAARQYLEWLADRRGITVPEGAIFRLDGVWSSYGKGAVLLVAMPGYGVPDVVTMETLDDSGAVIRSQPVAVSPAGAISLRADQVQAATGLAKVRQPRPAKRRPTLDPRRALSMSAEEMAAYCAAHRGDSRVAEQQHGPAAEPMPAPAPDPALVERAVEPVAPSAVPVEQPAGDVVAALLDRIAKLENAVDVLLLHALEVDTPARGNDTPPAVEKEPAQVEPKLPREARIRIVRRYLAMREEREQLRARVAEQNRRLDTLAWENDAALADLAAAQTRADRAETTVRHGVDEMHGRVVKLERDVSTWQRRAEQAGWKPQPFQLVALMTGKRPEAAA
ncbi:hypothetical protein [Sphingomonas sp. NFR15]|uniref:hypothetical protein n=1 Tax=Sphingomonas sp. NFR15 TaxID=1566282 RepID=UPI00087E16F6|nr:hypothetical protein [Sphingomonas sp. NFR15]SDA14792.1 hypothetical protein SAMN03159340_00595 [Sphingomonas sp. NFR15]